jgi:rubrerythrin
MKKLGLVALLLVLGLVALSFAVDTTPKMTTIDNLKAAFTGETTASAKYAAYSQKAAEEGHTKIALLFEAASKAEGIHAANHRAVLEQLGETAPEVKPAFEIKTTAENLQDAIKGETYEVETMYPEFIKNVQASHINIAGISFNYAWQTEENHKILYTKALDALNNEVEASLPGRYYVCTTCGNTYDETAPNRCAICMTAKEKFIIVG